MKNFFIFLSLLVVVVTIGIIAWWSLQMKEPTVVNPSELGETACTMEAKLCPDGSAVGRTGPDCEFAPCPTVLESDPALESDPTKEWETYSTGPGALAFRYPPDVNSTYVSATEWPPEVQALEGDFGCGLGELITFDGSDYCRTIETEGAAGSTYSTYTYLSNPGAGADFMTMVKFTLRYPQCSNYDEPELSACTEEQARFDVDAMAHLIAESVVRP